VNRVDSRWATKPPPTTTFFIAPDVVARLEGTELFDLALCVAGRTSITIERAVELLAARGFIARADATLYRKRIHTALLADPSYEVGGNVAAAKDGEALRARIVALAERTSRMSRRNGKPSA
jgi:hypothetical protein